MPERGDNFELVYDAHGWHAEQPPEPILALLLVVLLQHDKTGGQP